MTKVCKIIVFFLKHYNKHSSVGTGYYEYMQITL